MISSVSPDQNCEHLLFKPLDSCVLPGVIISGDGPFQWNAVGHQLLDFIIECGPELLGRCISGITGIK